MDRTLSIIFTGALLLTVWCRSDAQEGSQSDWSFMPSILIVDHFPSGRLESIEYGSKFQYEYSGTGIAFTLRAFRRDLDWVAFSLNAGADWYGSSTARGYTAPILFDRLTTDGIGGILHRKDFLAFPLTGGVELILPKSANHDVMFTLGGNAGMHFIDGDLDIGQQAKFGYSFGGGFAVKILEAGIRCYSFSDVRSIGAHVGVRLNTFSLK